jgi:hypothetical protein
MPIQIPNPQNFCEQVEPTEQAKLMGETSRRAEEVLVLDVRHGLTPAMMVDRKLQAMLGSQYRGIPHQRTGRSATSGRTSGK